MNGYQLNHLISLDLKRNELSTLPSAIGQLRYLTSLDLSWNKLQLLPPEIGYLTNLTSLNLSWNKLQLLPPKIGYLTNLTSFSLSKNQLSTLPPAIGRLNNLTSLDLSRNTLQLLPPEIGHLTNLTKLNLDNNKLRKLPSSIGQLTSLKRLNLSDNPGCELPPEISKLVNLTELELLVNLLKTLPPEIRYLTNLTKLDLRGNRLPIPTEILARINEPATIIKYYLGKQIKPVEANLRELQEREEVTALKKTLKPLRLQVHPQKYYPVAFSLGKLYYEELGDYTLARQSLVDGHQALEALRSLILKKALQEKLSAESARLYEILVHCYLVDRDQANAFEYAAMAKGRAFVNTLAKARLELSTIQAKEDDFVEKLQQVRQKRRKIEDLERQSSLSNDKRRGQQDILLREQAQLWRKMEHEHPLLTATLTVPTLSINQTFRLAQELDATLIEYYCHAGEWCAFVISKDTNHKETVRYVPLYGLTDSFLDKMVQWRNEVHLSIGRSRFADRRLAALYQAAVAPLGLKDNERVVIAPFERLHLLPLSAAYNQKTTRYFSEEHTLSFVPSLTALYVVNEENKTRAQVSKKAEEHVERLLSVAYPGPKDNYLPNVLKEARAIVERLPKVAARAIVVTALHEEEATANNVIKEAPNHHVIHFGCHGRFNSDKPEESGLRLAYQKTEASVQHSPYLTIQRIITELNLKQTRLATLAACLTGDVALRDGEEHVGLLQAMMTAGVQTVVGSLWRVDDEATRALFEAFYFREANIHSSAHAMKDASHLVRQQNKWTHPYYWAAFEVNGLTSRYKETTPLEWPNELLEHIKQDHKRSIPRGAVMDDQLILANAEVLLKQMVEYRSEIVPALEQHPLLEATAKKSIEPSKVGLAKALLLMVTKHPTLKPFFPEIQGQVRSLGDQEHEYTQGIPHPLQKAGAGENSMSELREKSINILKQKRIQPPAKGQLSLLDQFWALWKR